MGERRKAKGDARAAWGRKSTFGQTFGDNFKDRERRHERRRARKDFAQPFWIASRDRFGTHIRDFQNRWNWPCQGGANKGGL